MSRTRLARSRRVRGSGGGGPRPASRSAAARRAALALALCALAGAASPAPAPAAAPAAGPAPAGAFTPERRALALRSFDFIWNTVREKHWDPDLRGLDWEAVRDSLRPRVEAAASLDEARGAMRALLGTLGQSHFGVIPRATYDDLAGGSGGAGRGEGAPGVDLRVLDGRAIAVAVAADAPAAALGVAPGWELLRAGEEELPPLLASLGERLAGQIDRDFRLAMAVRARLGGAPGDTVATRWRDGAGREVDLRLPLAVPKGSRAVLGGLPPFYVDLSWRRLPAGPGYVALNVFFDPVTVMPAFARAMTELRDAPGLILDLRGNPGGIGNMALGMAGWLVAERGRSLGVMRTRGSQMNFAVIPRAVTYDGPVAVLVDGLSGSTAEILAGGLQSLGRARVFGTRTAGAALPAVTAELPDGDVLLYAVADYVTAAGVSLEGAGVAPDVEVALTRESLLSGKDAVLDAAVAWITGQGGAGHADQR